MKYWINMGDILYQADISKIAERFAKQTGGACRFIGSLCLTGPGNDYTEPYLTFWQEKHAPEHSNYFGLIRRGNGTMISNASSITRGTWGGLADVNTGEVLFSRYRHDFRRSISGNFTVDGGRDYTKYSGTGFVPVKLRVIRDRMILVEVDGRATIPESPQE
ncbi:MAG: hypothetical protein EOP83_15520 [Verrucomicrobiaceae bacterium]|nr:MAG: hypothetical protein EOP83_15520 [Verrucomicrobiaceae bacterium]